MKLSRAALEQFRHFGAQGGKARAARMAPEARKAVARRAAMTRWIRARFGTDNFGSLGLPGGELVDSGLAALARGEATPGSLVLSLAAPRLQREGVPIRHPLSDPEQRLYEALCRTSADLAHSRYNAYLAQISSFADAVRLKRLRDDAA